MQLTTLKRFAFSLIAASAAMVLSSTGTRAAQTWVPTNPVEIIIGAGPGGGADRSGRFLQSIMRDKQLIPVPAVVVNKPGAGGAIALSHLLQQSDSGHHLMVASPTLLTAHIVGRTKTPPSEVTPLALLYTEYMMLAVKSDSAIKTGKDFIERLRQDPQSLSITVGVGLGNMNHIAAALPLKKSGIPVRDLRVVVYKSIGNATTEVLGGHVDVVSATPAILLPHVQSGRLRVIALAAPKRLGGVFADVPTWREQGVDAVGAFYHMVVGAKGMRPEHAAYWDSVLGRVVATTEWKEMLAKFYLTEAYMDSAETRKFMSDQYEELRSLLTDLGLSKVQ